MNYLAHAYLSGEDHDILIGNFIGDAVKGNNLNKFSATVQTGLRLHRAIDYFSDNHSIHKNSRHRLRPHYRHYSGVIVDIFYDHFLAIEWSSFHVMPLQDFTEHVYKVLEDNKDVLPSRTNKMLAFMAPQDWLYNYSKLEGIERVLIGMSARTKFDSKMDEAIVDLKQHYELFKEEFLLFFPMLKQYVVEYLKSTK